MLNYDEIVTQAAEHRSQCLVNAEQQRLAQALLPAQPHPFCAWLGRQLITWGRQLQGEHAQPTFTAPLAPTSSGGRYG